MDGGCGIPFDLSVFIFLALLIFEQKKTAFGLGGNSD